MYIDKYKQEDGSYEEEDGCWHGTARDFIQCGVLGHCGCGDPDASLMLIRDMLQEVVIPTRRPDYVSPELWTLYYMLDKLGLIEHGFSLPGWLTQKGEELLSDLTELYGEE